MPLDSWSKESIRTFPVGPYLSAEPRLSALLAPAYSRREERISVQNGTQISIPRKMHVYLIPQGEISKNSRTTRTLSFFDVLREQE
jgi:hypothetical protein